MAIHQIIYQSTLRRALAEEELGRLVSQARIYNFSEAISGVLLYDGTHFLQLIEGTRDAVEALFGTIADDPRHFNVKPLFRGTVPRRSFASWSMALCRPTAGPLGRLISYLMPQNQRVLLPKGYDAREVNTDLLEEFVGEYPPMNISGYYRYASLQG